MGNTETKVQGQKIRYKGNAKLNYFGNVKIYECLGRERQIIAVHSSSKRQFDVMEHSSLKHQNLINFLTYDSDFSEVIGVQNQNVPFYFDLYKTPLSEILQSRKNSNTRFEIKELERIIKDLLSILVYYEKNYSDQTHWNLNPSTIFYDREIKSMKVYDNEVIQGKLACFYQHFNLQKVQGINYSTDSYCTPEIADALQNCYKLRHVVDLDIQESDKSFLTYNKHKIDVYLLGLVILECATYKSSEQLYDRQNFSMNQQEIDLRILNSGIKYGKGIENFLKLALKKETTVRLTPSQLQQQLQTLEISKSQQQQQQLQQPQQQQFQNRLYESQQQQPFNYNQQQNIKVFQSQVNTQPLRQSVSPMVSRQNIVRNPSPFSNIQASQIRYITQSSPINSRILNHSRNRSIVDVSPQRIPPQPSRVSVSPLNRTPTRIRQPQQYVNNAPINVNQVVQPQYVNINQNMNQYSQQNQIPSQQLLNQNQAPTQQQYQQQQQTPQQYQRDISSNEQPQYVQSYTQLQQPSSYQPSVQQQQTQNLYNNENNGNNYLNNQPIQFQNQNPAQDYQQNNQIPQQKQMDNEIGRLEQLNDRVNQALLKSKDQSGEFEKLTSQQSTIETLEQKVIQLIEEKNQMSIRYQNDLQQIKNQKYNYINNNNNNNNINNAQDDNSLKIFQQQQQIEELQLKVKLQQEEIQSKDLIYQDLDVYSLLQTFSREKIENQLKNNNQQNDALAKKNLWIQELKKGINDLQNVAKEQKLKIAQVQVNENQQ